MKKKTTAGLIVIVAIATIAMFAGCIEEPPSAPSVTPTPTPITELSLGESAMIYDGVLFTVIKYELVDSYVGWYENRTIYPPEGAKFLLVWVKGENIGEFKSDLPSNWNTRLLYKDRTFLRCTFNTRIENGYHGGSGVYPGVSEEGWIEYEVPKSFEVSQAKICHEVGRTSITWNLALRSNEVV